MANIPFVQFLSTNGDGTGTINMAGDYSDATGSGATDFFMDGSAYDQRGGVFIARLVVFLEDNGTIDADGFGNGSALSNGIDINYEESDDSVVVGLTPEAIKTNAHWGRYAYDIDVKAWGQGDEIFLCRWTLSKFVPSHLSMGGGRKLVATVNDNLSSLVEFTICAEGYYIPGGSD